MQTREERRLKERLWCAANRDKRRKVNNDYYERNKQAIREKRRLKYAEKKAQSQKSNSSYSSSSGDLENQ